MTSSSYFAWDFLGCLGVKTDSPIPWETPQTWADQDKELRYTGGKYKHSPNKMSFPKWFAHMR